MQSVGEALCAAAGTHASAEQKVKRKPIPKEGVIKLLVTQNPKRKSSLAYTRFELYKDGITVAEFLKAGGRSGDLQHDLDNKFIEITV